MICLIINKSFSVALSGGSDGSCILWDLNRFSYVRTITEHENQVQLLCISDTLGDIVSVSDNPNNDDGSFMIVHTINGVLVGEVFTDLKITAVCYSTAKEGISVNVIGTGFSNGTVKLWSSWNLTAVREITVEKFTKPIKWSV